MPLKKEREKCANFSSLQKAYMPYIPLNLWKKRKPKILFQYFDKRSCKFVCGVGLRCCGLCLPVLCPYLAIIIIYHQRFKSVFVILPYSYLLFSENFHFNFSVCFILLTPLRFCTCIIFDKYNGCLFKYQGIMFYLNIWDWWPPFIYQITWCGTIILFTLKTASAIFCLCLELYLNFCKYRVQH